MLAAPAKKERRFIESAMPADGTSAARCAHGDLGMSRLRAAEADVTRRLARVKEAPRPSASHRRNAARPFFHPRLELGRPEIVVGDVLERDGHDLARSVDRHMAEELQPEAGRQVVALCAAAPLLEDRARTERVVELLRSPSAGMEGAGNEFPERLEVPEHGLVGI